MNIISHITEMIAKGTPSAYVALGVAGLFALLAFFGALKGFTRGITRQTVRSVTIVISAVLAYFAATSLTSGVIGYLDGKTIEEVAVAGGFAEALAELGEATVAVVYGLSMETVQHLLALPFALVIAPIAFLVSFVMIFSQSHWSV